MAYGEKQGNIAGVHKVFLMKRVLYVHPIEIWYHAYQSGTCRSHIITTLPVVVYITCSIVHKRLQE